MTAVAVAIGDGSAYQGAVAAESGLLAYWKFDEASGSTCTDAIGGKVATCQGVESTAFTRNQAGLIGGTGKGVKFAGTADGATVPSASNPLLSQSSWSVELWFRYDPTTALPADTGFGTAGLLTVWQSDASTSHQGFSVFVQGGVVGSTGSTLLSVGAEVGDGSVFWTSSSGNGSIAPGEVVHAVWTWDDAAGTLKTYVNGKLKTTTTGKTYSPPTASSTLKLGMYSTQSQYRFPGLMDEVAVYSSVLTASQVSKHYDFGTVNGGANDKANRVVANVTRAVDQSLVGTDERMNTITSPQGTNATNFSGYAGGATVTNTPGQADAPSGFATSILSSVSSLISTLFTATLGGADSASGTTTGGPSALRSRGWMPCRGGQTVSFSAWFKGSTVVGNVRVEAYYRDGKATWVSSSNGGSQAVTGAWQNLTYSATLPAGTEWVGFYISWNGLTAGNAYSRYDTGHVITLGSATPSYFDGASTGARWVGTSGNSASAKPYALSGLVSGSRGVADTLGITDAATRLLLRNARFGDGLGITDSPAKTLTFARALADSLGAGDSVTLQRVAFARAIADALGIADSPDRGLSLNGRITDALGIADTASKIEQLARGVTDSLGASDALGIHSSFARAVADALGLADAVTLSQLGFSRATADTLGISDTPDRAVNLPRLILDILALSDSPVAGGSRSRTVTDMLRLSDTVNRAVGRHRAVSDTLGWSDAVVALLIVRQMRGVGNVALERHLAAALVLEHLADALAHYQADAVLKAHESFAKVARG